MSTETEVRPASAHVRPKMMHTFCPCSPDVGLCGRELAGDIYAQDEVEAECVVCADMEADVCPRCEW